MDYRFSDIVDLPHLQLTLAAFHTASGIPVQIVDLNSQIVAASPVPSFFSEFDQLKHNLDRSEAQNFTSNDERSLRRYEYPGGLYKYARALQVESQTWATLFLGPLFHASPQKDVFRKLAQELGGDETACLEQLKRVPIFTEEQVQSHLELLVQIIQQLGEKGLSEMRLIERLATSQERETKLQSAYDELAISLLKKTEELRSTREALQEGEQRFRVALIDTPIVVFNQDLDLRYSWIYNVGSYADQPVIGKTDADLFSPEDAMRLTTLKRRVMAAGLLTREEVSMTVGTRRSVYDMTLDPLFDAEGSVTGLTCAATDITERKQLYEQMQRRLAESESVQRIAKGLLQKSGLDEVLKIVCDEAMQLTDSKGSAVLLLEEDGWLKLTYSAGWPVFGFDRLPVEGSFAGHAFQTGSHVWVNLQDKNPDEAVRQLQGYPWTKGLMSLLVVPLKADTKLIGVLNILDKPGEITPEDLRIIDLFADQAAIIIEHVRLQHQAEQLAVLEERQRLARELHDSVTQALYSVTLYADAARMTYSAKMWAALERNLQEVGKMAREAMYDMRLLVFELRPFILETAGWVAALRARVVAVEGRSGLKTEVHVDGERRLSVVIEQELYRIAQESLNNVVKHAEAKEVHINIKYEDDHVSLEVIDDGRGFDIRTANQSGGVGLLGIQERVKQLGGSIEIESAPGNGTHLTVRIPVNE